ncbi:MAG TPA: CPBP family intramembrane glutamic endopeptidase [Rhizomicrobium sp.]|nr:CPBP family intramembrane glutamic endopeptidase [Rhizomicrobium sp.]
MASLLSQSPFARASAIARTLAVAIGSGVAIIIVSEAVWVGLIGAYSRHPVSFPWFVPAMAAFLMVGVAWLKWGTWPRYGREARRSGVRLNPVAPRIFLLSLAAGWTSFFSGAFAYVAYRILSGLGGEVPMMIPPGPRSAILLGLAMAAVVAGVVEEISVRGFMQGRLEKAFGVVPAIVISGFVWALFHTNHSYFDASPLDIAIWFAIFFAVSAILGTIASLTDSVLPGMVIHAGFDGLYFVSAGILQPRIAPLSFLETLASPVTFAMIAALLALLAIGSWLGLLRAVRTRRTLA